METEQLRIETIAAMVRLGSLRREALAAEVIERLERFEAGELDEDQPGLFDNGDNDNERF